MLNSFFSFSNCFVKSESSFMDKSKIQKILTESQIKEIRKIAVETAELIVIELLRPLEVGEVQEC